MQLNNKIILITGGTSGIGKSLAKALKKKNNHVIITGRNQTQLEIAKAEGFDTIACDLTSGDDREHLVMEIETRFPRLDVLFNNAGIQNNYHFTDSIVPLDRLHQEIEVNLSAQIVLTHLLLPSLNRSEQALIVNTTSGLAYYPKVDGLVYSASKAGFRSFTEGLRISLTKTNIQVVEFIPPVTESAMTRGRDENKMAPDDLVRRVIPQIEKGRRIVTVFPIRMFRWIAFLWPSLANKILSK